MSTPNCRFDLDLFIELNKEYESKPIVPRPRQHYASAMLAAAEKRAGKLDKLIDMRGKRVLEVGCGRGELCYVLAKERLRCCWRGYQGPGRMERVPRPTRR